LKSSLVNVLDVNVIGTDFFDDPTVCELLTLYVPMPPDPVPNPDINVPEAIAVPDDRKLYTAKFARVVVPGTVQEEVIVSVVPEINPLHAATFVPVDARLTLSVVKSCAADTHEPRGAVVGQTE